MDGGGRLVRPLSAGVPGGAAVATSPRSQLPSIRFSASSPGRGSARALGRRPARAPPAALGTVGLSSASSGSRAALARARRACPGAASDLRRAPSCPRPRRRPRHRAGHDRRHRGPDRGRGPERRRHLAARVAAVPERARDPRAARGAAPRQERVRPQALPRRARRHLVERDAHALWQKNGELFIIAADGTVVDTFDEPRFAYLPLVVGEQANLHTRDYLALIEAAGR